MKLFFLFSIAFFSSFILHSQTCYADKPVFIRQSQIDSFPINFPGCSSIFGEIEISGPDIMNLNALIGVKEILDLKISNTTNLFSLAGLDSLQDIIWDLDI